MKRLLTLFVFIVSFLSATTAVRGQQPKSLFYLTREPKSVRSFLAHADKIDLLVPAWYGVDADGLLSGGANPLVLETAKQHHVPVMPIGAERAFGQGSRRRRSVSQRGFAAYDCDRAERSGRACRRKRVLGVDL